MAHEDFGEAIDAKGPKPKDVNVTVTYLAAKKPFDTKVAPDATVAQIKTESLAAFKLKEGPTEDGQGQIVFFLFDDERQLGDAETIGAIAGNKGHVKFKLVKQIIQG